MLRDIHWLRSPERNRLQASSARRPNGCLHGLAPRLWQMLPIHLYGCVTVLNSLNGCSRPICLVLETAALCDALVRSAVYK